MGLIKNIVKGLITGASFKLGSDGATYAKKHIKHKLEERKRQKEIEYSQDLDRDAIDTQAVEKE